MWQYNSSNPNELMHYGKKGMKWGHRTGTKPKVVGNVVRGMTIGSYGNVKYNQARAQNKGRVKSTAIGVGNQIANNVTLGYRSVKDSKKITGDNSKTKVGNTLAKNLVLGSYGTTKYNQLRKDRVSVGESVLKAYGAGLANTLTAGYVQAYDAQNKGKVLRK